MTDTSVIPASSADIAFYTVSDSNYFLGVAALVNSLRLVGHQEQIVILDCGLTARQRELLAPHCTLIELSTKTASNPTYYKLIAPRQTAQTLKIIIDSDMIVTGHLGQLIDAVRAGQIVGFPDPERDRWFAEWQSIYQLPAVPRHQVYMCAGLVAVDTKKFPDFIEQWWTAVQRTSGHATIAEGVEDGPTAQADQDALNALLMSTYPPEAAKFLPYDACAQAWELKRHARVLDLQRLTCVNRGTGTLILHAAGQPKPWRSMHDLQRTPYVRLLLRLIFASDIPVRPDPEMVPTWLRQDLKGRTQLWSAHLLALQWRARRVLHRYWARACRRLVRLAHAVRA